MNSFYRALLGCVWLSLLSPLVQAGDGHDHDAPPVSAAQKALPRLAITGQQFELVGELGPTQLTLYIDWLATTTPAAGAKLQVQLNDQPLSVAETAPGTFVASLPATWAEAHADEHGDEQENGLEHDHDHQQAAQPGELQLVATIALQQTHEQLQGHFDLPAGDHAEPGHAHYGRWLAAVAALLLAGLVLVAWRRRGHGGGQ